MNSGKLVGVLVLVLIFVLLIWNRINIAELEKIPLTGKASTNTANVGVSILSVCGNNVCESTEDCSSCSQDCGACPVTPPTQQSSGTTSSSGGGGGSSTIQSINFRFDPDLIQEKLFVGDSITRNINVKNIGSKNIQISLNLVDLTNFVYLSKESLTLKENEEKDFDALIKIPDDTEHGVYIGDIVGTVSKYEKTLPVILTVRERGAPFVINVEIVGSSELITEEGIVGAVRRKVVAPGEDAMGDITITNNLKPVQVTMEYSIRDRDENIISSGKDIVNLNLGDNLFTKELPIPKNLEEGYYLFYANFIYENEGYEDAATFRVEKTSKQAGLLLTYSMYLKILLLIIVIFALLFVILKLREKKKVIEKEEKPQIERKIDYDKLVIHTLNKLEHIKSEIKSSYNIKFVDEYFKIMRDFFADYYGLKHSLTFEEIIKEFSKKNIKIKREIISLVNKISHVPYEKDIIDKAKFNEMIDETINVVNYYKKHIKHDDKKPKKGIKEKLNKIKINSKKKKISKSYLNQK